MNVCFWSGPGRGSRPLVSDPSRMAPCSATSHLAAARLMRRIVLFQLVVVLAVVAQYFRVPVRISTVSQAERRFLFLRAASNRPA